MGVGDRESRVGIETGVGWGCSVVFRACVGMCRGGVIGCLGMCKGIGVG